MIPESTSLYYRRQQQLTRETLSAVLALWQRMGVDFDASWATIGPTADALVTRAQKLAASNGIAYVPEVLDETGQSTVGLSTMDAAAFAGVANNGRPVSSVLRSAVVAAKSATLGGGTPAQALLAGRGVLERAVPTLIADADRNAVQATLTPTKVTGYVRMLNAPSCSRCVILAGKWFRWNQGFQRHPRCDCRHIPSSEAASGDYRTDPYAYFNSLSEAEQDKLFGATNAQAIRDGGDIWRIENIRVRGMMRTEGRNLGWNPPRLTLDEVYAQSGNDRVKAVAILKQQGYITGEQKATGNLRADAQTQFYLGAGSMGRGGTRKGATAAHRRAAATGVRDPLDPATQTAAERRLAKAVYSKRAVDEGRNPFSSRPLTQREKDAVEALYERELKKLRKGSQPKQVHELARLLGVRI